MTELVIAAVAAPFGRDLEACFRTIDRVLGEARVCGARLVVLPEGALGGHCPSPVAGEQSPAMPVLDPDGPELKRVAALARELTVCVGFAEDGGGVVHTSAACVSGDGVLGLHRKLGQRGAGDCHSRAGDRPAAFDTPVGRIGMLVCNDKALPEAARMLALDGADILACLSAWPCSRTSTAEQLQDGQWRLSELWDRARAAENQVVVASANQTGRFGSLRFFGGARIVGPGGDPLAATGTQPGLALARVDVAGLIARARRAMAQLRDLRPDVYRLSGPLAA